MVVRHVVARLGEYRVLRRDVQSDTELIDAVRAGLPASSLDHLIHEFAEEAGARPYVCDAVGKTRTSILGIPARKRDRRGPADVPL